MTLSRRSWAPVALFSGEATNVEVGVTNELFPNQRASSVASCLFNATPEDFTGGEGIAEANAVIAKFNALTATQQQDIINFLRSP
jgi:hypothetical protein